MSKISNEIRLEAVQRVVEDGMSISASARLAGVHKSMLQEWVMQYREHGAEGVIKQDRKQKKYTGEFKIEVVEYAHTNHLSAGAASAHFGLPTKSLFLKWERIYYEEGPQALLEEHRGRASKMGLTYVRFITFYHDLYANFDSKKSGFLDDFSFIMLYHILRIWGRMWGKQT